MEKWSDGALVGRGSPSVLTIFSELATFDRRVIVSTPRRPPSRSQHALAIKNRVHTGTAARRASWRWGIESNGRKLAIPAEGSGRSGASPHQNRAHAPPITFHLLARCQPQHAFKLVLG